MYPLLADAMTDVVSQDLETYISCHHNTVVEFITTSPIMDLCLEAERRTGSTVTT